MEEEQEKHTNSVLIKFKDTMEIALASADENIDSLIKKAKQLKKDFSETNGDKSGGKYCG